MIRPPLLCCCLPMIIYLSNYLSLSISSFLSFVCLSLYSPKISVSSNLAIRYVNFVKSFFKIHCPTIPANTRDTHSHTLYVLQILYNIALDRDIRTTPPIRIVEVML